VAVEVDKPLFFVGRSREDLQSFPEEVRRTMGYALRFAQGGTKHPAAKPLRGYGGAGVLEIIDEFLGDTYRGVYTVKFDGAVYVLHAFEKKSKQGIKTPQGELAMIERRLKLAQQHYDAWRRQREIGNDGEPKPRT
jgi:phage-related protein